MEKVLAVLRREPVRVFLYPVLALVLGVLVTKGFITKEYENTITQFVVLLLGVPAVEIARSKVSPASSKVRPVN